MQESKVKMVDARPALKRARAACSSLTWRRDTLRDSRPDLCAPITLWAPLGNGVVLYLIDENCVSIVLNGVTELGQSSVCRPGTKGFAATEDKRIERLKTAIDKAINAAVLKLDAISDAVARHAAI